MFWLLPVALSGGMLLASPPEPSTSGNRELRTHAASLLTTPDRRVRTLNSRVQGLLAEGTRRSETFAKLIVDLNRTDVIVYVELVGDLRRSLAGRLLLLPLSNGQRYLRVQLRSETTSNDAIALIAHELRHALEIAGAPEVRDQDALIALYERIGLAGRGLHSYDTAEAQTTGRVVRNELAS